jgi:hypothetical protein
MSVKIIVSMDIEDFDSWSAGFNAGSDSRKEAGIEAEAYKNLDNPNNAVAIGTASSKEAFLAYFATPEQAERMQSAGVVSQPVITFLETEN